MRTGTRSRLRSADNMHHVLDPPVEASTERAAPEILERCAIVTLAIAGMECQDCANRIRNALLAHPGVVETEADAGAALARVWYDPERVSVEEILGVVAVVGEWTQHQFLAVALGRAATR